VILTIGSPSTVRLEAGDWTRRRSPDAVTDLSQRAEIKPIVRKAGYLIGRLTKPSGRALK